MDELEITLQILLKMMDKDLAPRTNPELTKQPEGNIDPEKLAECYNKIFRNLKTIPD